MHSRAGRSSLALRVPRKDPWTNVIYHKPAVARRTMMARCSAPTGLAPCRSVRPRRAQLVPPTASQPPASALGPLFRYRLEQIHACRVNIDVEVNRRPTRAVLGGYYKSRRLVRVYSHDRVDGPRPLEELFETFLHEVAHHLEYTEPQTFGSRGMPPRLRARCTAGSSGESSAS